MKLRNKKTGEIVQNFDGFTTYTIDWSSAKNLHYTSLTELNEEWEDYKSAEPLIKDEKIRKAVRAWAEAFDVEKIYYDAKMLRLHDSKCKTVIGITYPILGVWDRKEPYTIAELCGEDDE